MKTLRGVLVVLLSAFGLVALGSATAYACDCAIPTPRSALGYADVVVDATVVEKHEPTKLVGMDSTRYLLEVHSVLKGEATQRLEFESNYSGAACGLEGVNAKQRGVFFLYHPESDSSFDPDADLVANLCGGTMRFTAAEVERVSGPRGEPRSDASPVAGPVAREPEPGGPSRLWPTSAEVTAYAVGGTLLALLLGGGWVLMRRRSLARR